MDDTFKLNRRTFLFSIASAAAVGVVWVGRHHGVTDPTSVNSPAERADMVNSLTSFTEVMAGFSFSQTDREELNDRLDFALEAETAVSSRLVYLARYLDEEARSYKAVSFSALTKELRQEMLESITRKPTKLDYYVAKLLPGKKQEIEMRKQTMNEVLWIYRHSGVPWRRRGYVTWPGVPGDELEHTRPGGAKLC